MTRKVVVGDMFEVLRDFFRMGDTCLPEHHSIITSLPDISEVSMDEAEYGLWFSQTVEFLLNVLDDDKTGCLIIYNTDRKMNGGLLSKAHLAMEAATIAGAHLLWHKIACTTPVGTINQYRPGYSHMLAFAFERKSGKAIPDVFEAGPKVYKNGLGLNAARVACTFLRDTWKTTTIIDPMCGRGTVLAMAEKLGMDAIGIDIDPMQCDLALNLELPATLEDLE